MKRQPYTAPSATVVALGSDGCLLTSSVDYTGELGSREEMPPFMDDMITDPQSIINNALGIGVPFPF